MRAFELNTVRLTDAEGAEGVGLPGVLCWMVHAARMRRIRRATVARYFALLALGFHDTSFGDHVEVGLHAVAVDEHRWPFVPTFWTIPRGKKPKATWSKPGSLVRTATSAAAIPMRD